MITFGQVVIQDLPLDQRNRAVWFLLLGIGLFLGTTVYVISSKDTPSRVEKWIQRIADWFQIRDWQLLLLIASPLLAWAAWRAAGEGRVMTNPAAAILAWFSAILAVMVGSVPDPLRRIQFNIEPRKLILPFSLTLTAFLARAIAMDRFPIALTGDEGSAGIEAVQVLRNQLNNPFISVGYSFPSLYYLLQSLSIRLLGQTTEALRFPSALAGALTVLALFYVGRSMFDRRTGLLAAIFVAAYSFHIHFSRIGLNNIWDGLWYTIFIGALWRGWEQEDKRSLVLAGIVLGAAQYFYPSGRALIIPILAWLALMAFINRQKFKRVFAGMVIMFVATVVVVLPLAMFYLHHPQEYMAPFARVSIFGSILDGMVQSTGQPAWVILLNQIWKGLQGFIYLPLTAWYQPGTPLLRPLAASLFVIGFLLLMSRGRDSRFLLLALWILTFGLIGGLSESTPASQRYVAAAPVCALLIGFGLSELMSILEGLWLRLTRILSGAAIALAVLIAIEELNFYFITYTQKTIVDGSHNNTMIAHHLTAFLRDKPSDVQVVFMGAPMMGYYSIPSLQYLVPHIKGVDATVPWQSFDKSTLAGKHLIFVFLPGNDSALNDVMLEYSGGQPRMEMAADGKPLYWYYEYTNQLESSP